MRGVAGPYTSVSVAPPNSFLEWTELVAVDSYLLSTFIETSLLSKIYLLSTPLVGMDGIGGATPISTRI